MIHLAGRKWAANEKEMVDSLFQVMSTCAGYYRKSRSKKVEGILFMDLQKQPFAFAAKRDGVAWFVTASGKPIRYMNALCTVEADRLGLSGMGYREQREAAAALFEAVALQTT